MSGEEGHRRYGVNANEVQESIIPHVAVGVYDTRSDDEVEADESEIHESKEIALNAGHGVGGEVAVGEEEEGKHQGGVEKEEDDIC